MLHKIAIIKHISSTPYPKLFFLDNLYNIIQYQHLYEYNKNMLTSLQLNILNPSAQNFDPFLEVYQISLGQASKQIINYN